jgi:hypothetical protein
VADAGLLSKNNISKLKNDDYTFIVGARIKNESVEVKDEIIEQSRSLSDGDGV